MKRDRPKPDQHGVGSRIAKLGKDSATDKDNVGNDDLNDELARW